MPDIYGKLILTRKIAWCFVLLQIGRSFAYSSPQKSCNNPKLKLPEFFIGWVKRTGNVKSMELNPPLGKHAVTGLCSGSVHVLCFYDGSHPLVRTIVHVYCFPWPRVQLSFVHTTCTYKRNVGRTNSYLVRTIAHVYCFPWPRVQLSFVRTTCTYKGMLVRTNSWSETVVRTRLILYVQSRFFCSCKAVVRAIVRAKVLHFIEVLIHVRHIFATADSQEFQAGV